MSLNRWAAKRDQAERPIIDALEAVGALVIQLDRPVDLLVWYRLRWVVAEVKTGSRKPNAEQATFIRDCLLAGIPVGVWRTPEDALRDVGAIH